MKEVFNYLESSIKDNYFSKKERHLLENLLDSQVFGRKEIDQLKSKIYDLAKDKIDSKNYDFILQWTESTIRFLENYFKSGSKVYFSPGEECRDLIVKHLKMSKKKVDICVFTISDNVISHAIVETHKRGIELRIISDNDKAFDKGSDIRMFEREGISLKLDNTSDHMHHKFMIVDDKIALTGSYNWTRSAALYNHENILVNKEETVIKAYKREFADLWEKF